MKQTIEIRAEHSGHSHEQGGRACMSRRQFLLSAGALTAVVTVGGIPGMAFAKAIKADYPRSKVGSLAALAKGEPVEFAYPYPDVANILVKLGKPAGGGVGADKDVVAFNQQCTHMGGPLQGSYKDAYQVLGPCPMHLTTFDLTKHGMVVAGHGTESLPQILLEVE
ncbi:MAG: arsenate reductase (azurin) small subunit, partial [Rhodocyclales bacterium]|nr:arsenate reductase (azurin) small subunit [Rhodocyclales bacterium]